MKFKVKGAIVPVFTPFKHNGDLDLEIIDDYLEFLLKPKTLAGILVNGTSGEGMSMNLQERKAVAEEWIVLANKRTHVMIQVGGTSLPDVIELAKHAEENGADSILCLPDLYMKPKTVNELIDYLKIVSDAAPNTPLLYYHIPMFTNVTIHMGQFLNQIKDSIPTFVGIKFTSNDLDEGYQAINADKKRFAVFLGADSLMLSAACLGFTSTIATSLNFFTDGGQYLMNKEIDIKDRELRQALLNNRIEVITRMGHGWVPSMKAAMNLLSPISCGPVRPPMKRFNEDEVECLKQWLLSK